MKKTILTLLGSALIAATAVQAAAAATERPRVHRVARTPAQISEPIRNANDSWQPLQAGTDWSRYQNGAYSAPAGR
jgi:hypothetical protein